ncbi:hypothetical protein LFT45_10530 [Arthrobacter sp. FW305-BF8]|uniref:hypothetical protein n=1 Tax=Arthrobacter sp. FW305-BF8 TaxID=2879617 RepID=UPI001F267A3F|nr:hypothetical protein [Arthrobacter sp. FW305-BF8]UKA56290.1 hypothetical protein LFT45_10530 [Arthrobacter sp. FW305-BF8]
MAVVALRSVPRPIDCNRWSQSAALALLVSGLTDFTLRITALTLTAAALTVLGVTGHLPASGRPQRICPAHTPTHCEKADLGPPAGGLANVDGKGKLDVRRFGGRDGQWSNVEIIRDFAFTSKAKIQELFSPQGFDRPRSRFHRPHAEGHR